MLKNFVAQTINLLKRSDITIRSTEFREVTFEDSDNNTHTVNISVSDCFNATSLADNLILQVMIFFSVLDAKIDIMFPDLQGESFRKKYQKIPKTDDNLIILSQIFRIFKILRNASVHSMNAITINDNVINVSYSFGNTNYELEINKPGLELLYTLVLDFIDPVVLNEKYSAGLRRTLYDDLKGHIHKLSDEFGHTGLENISSGLRLKRIVRYQVTNPTYEIRDNHLIINSIYET